MKLKNRDPSENYSLLPIHNVMERRAVRLVWYVSNLRACTVHPHRAQQEFNTRNHAYGSLHANGVVWPRRNRAESRAPDLCTTRYNNAITFVQAFPIFVSFVRKEFQIINLRNLAKSISFNRDKIEGIYNSSFGQKLKPRVFLN